MEPTRITVGLYWGFLKSKKPIADLRDAASSFAFHSLSPKIVGNDVRTLSSVRGAS